MNNRRKAVSETNADSSWDFWDENELIASDTYIKEGFIIENADLQYLNLCLVKVEAAFQGFHNNTNLFSTF